MSWSGRRFESISEGHQREHRRNFIRKIAHEKITDMCRELYSQEKIDEIDRVANLAIEIMEKYYSKPFVSSQRPSTVAAGCIYLAGICTGDNLSQHDFQKWKTSSTVREMYRNILRALGYPCNVFSRSTNPSRLSERIRIQRFLMGYENFNAQKFSDAVELYKVLSKVLSSPTGLHTMLMLYQERLSLQDLKKRVHLPSNSFQHYLKYLEKFGFVKYVENCYMLSEKGRKVIESLDLVESTR